MSSTCNQIWGVKTMQPSMKCQKYATKVWGVESMQSSMKCWKHAIKYDMSKTCNQTWGVAMHTNIYEVSKGMQPKKH